MRQINTKISIILLFAVCLAGTANSVLAMTVIRTVGASGCDYSTIQPAIDFMALQPADSEKIIRIATDKFYNGTALTLEDVSVTLEGGYATCASASPDSGEAVLRGNTLSPVIQITATATIPKVDLRNLSLSLGGGSSGGGLSVQGDSKVTAHNLLFIENSSLHGGAIHLSEGASLTFIDLVVQRNEADLFGGGIYCSGGGQVVGLGGSIFSNNEAGVGGAFHNDFCLVDLSGSHSFIANSAFSGGAISNHGGQMRLSSRLRGDIHIVDNWVRTEPQGNTHASLGDFGRVGGGIVHLSGSMSVQDAIIEGNLIPQDPTSCGGGVGVEGGIFTMGSSGNFFCNGGSCSSLKRNKAEKGSALCVKNDGQVEISKSRIEENVGAFGGMTASAILIEGGTLGIRDSILATNATQSVVDVLGSGALTLVGTTVAENYGAQHILQVGSNAEVEVYASILWQPSASVIDASPAATLVVECVLANDLSTLPPGSLTTDSDPKFFDPSRGNFRLNASSPAIDFCDSSTVPSTAQDLDGGQRDVNSPEVPDHSPGAHLDLGADEFGSSGFLFVDDFESGDLSAWLQT